MRKFSIRLPETMYKSMIDLCQKEGLDASKFLRKKIFNIIADKTYNKGDLKMARKDKTELHYNLFHVKNTIRTVLDLARVSFLVSVGKDIDMKPINAVIHEAQFVYKKMPKKDRALLKNQMGQLEKFRDIGIIRKVLSIDKYMIQQEKEIIHKADSAIGYVKAKNE